MGLGRVLDHLPVGVEERDHLGAGHAPEHRLLVFLVFVLHEVQGAGVLPAAERAGVLHVNCERDGTQLGGSYVFTLNLLTKL